MIESFCKKRGLLVFVWAREYRFVAISLLQQNFCRIVNGTVGTKTDMSINAHIALIEPSDRKSSIKPSLSNKPPPTFSEGESY